MTPAQFRKLALSMPEATEGAHQGHPDFRANGRVFATLHPDGKWGMVKLPADAQARLARAHPETFVPASGAWGRAGCTNVHLSSVEPRVLEDAMTLAWQEVAQRAPGTPAKPAPHRPPANKPAPKRPKQGG